MPSPSELVPEADLSKRRDEPDRPDEPVLFQDIIDGGARYRLDPDPAPVAEIQTAFEASDIARWTTLGIAFWSGFDALTGLADLHSAGVWSEILSVGILAMSLFLLWRRDSTPSAWALLSFCIANLFALAVPGGTPSGKDFLGVFVTTCSAVYVLRLMNRRRQLENRETRSMRAVP